MNEINEMNEKNGKSELINQPNEVQAPETETPISSLEDVPDGGIKAWCTVFGGWLTSFATLGYASSFGVFQDFYVLHGTSSSSNVSWIGSTFLFFFIAMGLPTGKLVDSGYFKHVLLIGSLLYIFSMFMLSLAHVHKYYQLFLSQGLGMGIGSGLVYVSSVAVQAHHFKARRATALGIVITGSSVGGIVYPIMLNNLVNDSVGFGGGVRASGYLTLAILIAANLLMTDRVSVNKRRASIQGPQDKPQVITDIPFLFAVMGLFFVIWGLFFPYFYLQLFTQLHGLPERLAFYQLTIQNAASVFGRIIPNILADKYGSINGFILSSIGTGVLVFAMFGIGNVGGVVVFSILYGFFQAQVVLSLFVPVIVSFANGVHEIGARIGIAYSITCWAFLTGTPITGALFKGNNVWFRPIIFNGVIVLAGVPFLLLSRHMQVARRGSWKV